MATRQTLSELLLTDPTTRAPEELDAELAMLDRATFIAVADTCRRVEPLLLSTRRVAASFELPHLPGFTWQGDDVLVHASLPDDIAYALVVERHRDGNPTTLEAVRIANPAERTSMPVAAVAWLLGVADVDLPDRWAAGYQGEARHTCEVPGAAMRMRFDGSHLHVDDGPSTLEVNANAVRILLEQSRALEPVSDRELDAAKAAASALLTARAHLGDVVDELGWHSLERSLEARTLLDFDLAFGVWFDRMCRAPSAWRSTFAACSLGAVMAMHTLASGHAERVAPPDAAVTLVDAEAATLRVEGGVSDVPA